MNSHDGLDPTQLISAYLDGKLDDHQADALHAWLGEDDAHLRELLLAVQLHHGLYNCLRLPINFTPDAIGEDDFITPDRQPIDTRAAAEAEAPQSMLDKLARLDEQTGPLPLVDLTERLELQRQAELLRREIQDHPAEAELDSGPRVIVIPRWAAWGLAAMVMLSAALLMWPHREAVSPNPDQLAVADEPVDEPPAQAPLPPVVARVAGQWQAQWAEGYDGSGDFRQGVPAELLAGLAELRFNDGAVVVIEAPATFVATGPNAMHFATGRLSAKVPDSAHGFTVITPEMDVVDLGTEFGVDCTADGLTRTHVMNGLVEVALPHRPASTRQLEPGRALQAEPDNLFLRPARYEGTSFYPDLETKHYEPTITGDARFLRRAPHSLLQDHTESDQISVLLERRGMIPPYPITVIPVAGAMDSEAVFKGEQFVSFDQPVDSYLLHFDSATGYDGGPWVMADTTITFDRPIVGLLLTNEQLAGSDPLFSHPDCLYFQEGEVFARSLDYGGDTVEISEDRKTLTVHMRARHFTDQLRVLVQAKHLDPDGVSSNPSPSFLLHSGT